MYLDIAKGYIVWMCHWNFIQSEHEKFSFKAIGLQNGACKIGGFLSAYQPAEIVPIVATSYHYLFVWWDF